MNVLHIDSGILGDHSVSRRLTAAVAAQIKAEHSGATVTYRDLVANPLPHLSGAHLMAANAEPDQVDTQIAADVAESKVVLDEFLAADTVILGVPMYNFSLPSQLKAWIDRIAVAGRTFQYSEKGPVGLAGGKVVIVASTRGGFYGPGTAMAALDHQESYLRSVFGFLGITDIRFVRAEGVALGEEQRARSMDDAARAIEGLAA